jgi:hypothetical protein
MGLAPFEGAEATDLLSLSSELLTSDTEAQHVGLLLAYLSTFGEEGSNIAYIIV